MSIFIVHEQASVYSASEKQWLDGIILEYGSGQHVGAVKVAYLSAGKGTKEKWIAPREVHQTLRKDQNGVHFRYDQRLRVRSQGVWFNAIITNALPDGAVEVQYDIGTAETIPAADFCDRFRAMLPHFSVNEKVTVFDPSSEQWFDGTVREVASQDRSLKVEAYNLQIALGSPRVLFQSPNGDIDKWIPLELCPLRIRQHNSIPGTGHVGHQDFPGHSPQTTDMGQYTSYEELAPQSTSQPQYGVAPATTYAGIGDFPGQPPHTSANATMAPFASYEASAPHSMSQASYAAPQSAAMYAGHEHLPTQYEATGSRAVSQESYDAPAPPGSRAGTMQGSGFPPMSYDAGQMMGMENGGSFSQTQQNAMSSYAAPPSYVAAGTHDLPTSRPCSREGSIDQQNQFTSYEAPNTQYSAPGAAHLQNTRPYSQDTQPAAVTVDQGWPQTVDAVQQQQLQSGITVDQGHDAFQQPGSSLTVDQEHQVTTPLAPEEEHGKNKKKRQGKAGDACTGRREKGEGCKAPEKCVIC